MYKDQMSLLKHEAYDVRRELGEDVVLILRASAPFFVEDNAKTTILDTPVVSLPIVVKRSKKRKRGLRYNWLP